MITVKKLKELGCDTDKGLERCLGDEDFYLEFVPDALKKERYERLEALIKNKDLDAAFEAAHGLKGILSNLSLDPVLEPVAEMTELLRARTDTDYSGLLAKMWERYSLFEKL
ncbi:MAG: Hpt domain-containing protein [Lachnospiraceae bacterium]|nr:Hpt domain-containing protein [Lachnospiraceae bacterium]